ncbi:hypothetical protein HCB27_14370 [Listeria booriae]|uniref:SGNH hydrolase-type esterase domain-containing protein n=1 Tax=Listeria booriae TaxID=1552123 RepID=A0A7X0Z8C5_9LIST|nr:hypothetical protein [Listeria booriae]MBC2177766.1 hypothetical protein [Listeria booriae]MBC2177813.1 hypothetical protein [Listeria booriae]
MFNFDSIRNMENLLTKKTSMLAACTEEKIVLLGGSSVLYGFNTNEMQRRLGKPTYNAGVNVGLGFRYMLDKVEPHLKPGDHVLLPLEFNQYTNPPYYVFGFGIDTFLHRNYWQNHKKYQQKWKLLLISLKHARSSATPEKLSRRKAAVLTDTGCYLGLDMQVRDPQTLKGIPFPDTFEETKTMVEIADFITRCRANNIQVTLLPPVFYTKNMATAWIEDLYDYFQETVSPEIFRLTASEVYDSVYHANQQGQTRVTNQLISELQNREELTIL